MQFAALRNLGGVAIFIISLLGILVLNVPALNSAAKNTVFFVFKPVQQNLWNIGGNANVFFSSFFQMRSAVEDNEKLRQRVSELSAQISQSQNLKQENDFLRQGLNLELDKDFDLKLANIIGKNIGGDNLIIDKGSDNMIEAGMPVITSEKILVGRILKVYKNFSEVNLVTSKNFSFDVKIGSITDGLVKGRGNSEAIIDLVSKDREIKSGDTISTSVLGGIFPPGLLVGVVKDVAKNDIETFQTATISLAFDADHYQNVFVASGKNVPVGFDVVTPQKKK
jgi:rod shape-determining protein MreC